MEGISLEIDGIQHRIEVLGVERMDANRSAIKVRAKAKLDRGRSCTVRAGGKDLLCIISNFTPMGDVYVVELKCLEDAGFLTERRIKAE